MKITELIEKLQEIAKEHPHARVMSYDDHEAYYIYGVDYDKLTNEVRLS